MSASSTSRRLLVALSLVAIPASAQEPPSTFHWGDCDGDGLRDALVLTADARARLLRNRGDGTLQDVTAESGLGEMPLASLALWEDVDRDGALDLFVGTHAGPSRLFLGRGDGTFEEAAGLLGIDHSGADLAAAFVDYDEDGWPDLHVHGQGAGRLYRNAGGTFRRVELPSLGETRPGPAEGGITTPAGGNEPAAGSRASAGSARREEARDDGARSTVTPSGGGYVENTAPPAGSPTITSVEQLALGSACADSLRDQATGDCLKASSTPTLGRLYPLSSDLFVDAATGYVGLGTEAPGHRLDVDGDLAFGGGGDGIRFRGTTAPTAPMITMFDTCCAGDGRMVLAHSPGFEEWGLRYDDLLDAFVFQQADFVPVLEVEVGTSRVVASADLVFTDDKNSITFPVPDTQHEPMIYMSDVDAPNWDRMLVAVSPAEPERGIRWLDALPGFSIQETNASPSLRVFLGQFVKTDVPMYVDADETGNVFRGHRTTSSDPSAPLVDLDGGRLRSGDDLIRAKIDDFSTASSQYIQCQDYLGDIDFRVDADGEVFSDVGFVTPADFAEMIEVSTGHESVEPGDLVVIDPARPRAVLRSDRARSTLVMGIYSTRPGVIGTEREWDVVAPAGSDEAAAGDRLGLKRGDMARLYDEVPIAVLGIVPAKVSAENGPIRPGDLLVSSDTPGHAMRADRPAEPGTIVGKALGTLAAGTGKIRVLVTLQ